MVDTLDFMFGGSDWTRPGPICDEIPHMDQTVKEDPESYVPRESSGALDGAFRNKKKERKIKKKKLGYILFLVPKNHTCMKGRGYYLCF